MATVSNTPRPGYVWDSTDNVWYPIGVGGHGHSDYITQATAVNPTIIDAKGDIITATAADTPARLAVGTANQVLTVDSSTATGLKWATPATAASGFVFIKRASFSAVANTSTTFQSIASATYKTYMIVFEKMYAATATDDFQIQLAYGATTATTGYYGSYTPSYSVSAAVSSVGYRSANESTLAMALGGSSAPGNGFLYVTVLGVSGLPTFNGQYYETNTTNEPATTFGGGITAAQVYDGFVLKSSSSNITGTVSVYGLATS